MARLIRANGQIEPLSPANGKLFTLQELHECVGGYIELVPNTGHLGVDMLCNEDGHRLELPFNEFASLLALQPLVGNVLALRREEWAIEEEEEEEDSD